MFVSAVFEQNCSATSPWHKCASSASLGNCSIEMSRVGLTFCKPVAVVEQRRAERDGHGQIVRKHVRPEQAGIWRRVSLVQRRRLAAFHEKGDPLGQGSKQPLESGAILRQNVEAHDQRGRWLRRNHARLMEAIERLRVLSAVIAGRERFGWRRSGLRAKPQADGAARQPQQEIAPSGLQPASRLAGFRRSRRERAASLILARRHSARSPPITRRRACP